MLAFSSHCTVRMGQLPEFATLGTVVAMLVVDPSDRSLTGESEVSGVSSEPVGLILFQRSV